jgi:hypothetical protein
MRRRRWSLVTVLIGVLLAGLAGAGSAAAMAVGPLLVDDFEDGNASGWSTSGGRWRVTFSDDGSAYRQSSTSARAVARAGERWWEDYTVAARVRATSPFGGDRGAGVIARANGSTTYFSLEVRVDRIKMAKTVSGRTTELASAPFTATVGTWYDVALSVFGDQLTGTVDGVTVSATDASVPYGRVGLIAQYQSAEFDDVLVDPTPPGQPDQQPPSRPARPSLVELTPTTATISWPPAVDNVGVVDYVVVHGYQFYSSEVRVLVTGTSVTLPLSPTAANQHFSVAARDAAGNTSPLSDRLFVTQPPSFPRTGNDTVPPTSPGAPFVSGVGPNGFQISWTASTDNIGVVEYHVYHAYDVDTVEVVAKVSGTTATVRFRSFPNSFRIVAYDASWNAASGPSTILNPTTPPPTPPPTR